MIRHQIWRNTRLCRINLRQPLELAGHDITREWDAKCPSSCQHFSELSTSFVFISVDEIMQNFRILNTVKYKEITLYNDSFSVTAYARTVRPPCILPCVLDMRYGWIIVLFADLDVWLSDPGQMRSVNLCISFDFEIFWKSHAAEKSDQSQSLCTKWY